MLAFEPKTTAEHRAAWPGPLRRLFHAEDVARGGERPGQCRENVLDFPDGLRLIVSREVPDSGPPVLHVSASVFPGQPLYLRVRWGMPPEAFLRLALARFRWVAGDVPLRLIGLSTGKLVPHWHGEVPGETVDIDSPPGGRDVPCP